MIFRLAKTIRGEYGESAVELYGVVEDHNLVWLDVAPLELDQDQLHFLGQLRLRG